MSCSVNFYLDVKIITYLSKPCTKVNHTQICLYVGVYKYTSIQVLIVKYLITQVYVSLKFLDKE